LNSLDTNVLYDATNTAFSEHEMARVLLERVGREPLQWIIAEQALFEYYRLVRNPVVLAKPLSADEAAKKLRFFRDELGCQHCERDRGSWEEVILGLAVTLRRNGVDTFYTRNVADFESFGWLRVIDPLA
jgi:hypothetical protein